MTAKLHSQMPPSVVILIPTSVSLINFLLSTQKGTFIPCGLTHKKGCLSFSCSAKSCKNTVPGSQVAIQQRETMFWLKIYCSYHSESTSLEKIEVFPLVPFCHVVGQLTPLPLSCIALLGQYLTSWSPSPVHLQTQQSGPHQRQSKAREASKVSTGV